MGTLKLASYNMHGWKNGLPMLDSLFDSNEIIVLQEHWLLPGNTDIINSYKDTFDCVAVSGCLDITEWSEKDSWPFDGVAVLWRKNKNIKVSFLAVGNILL